MNWSRLVMAAVAAWVTSIVLGFFINTVLFADLYAANQAAFRAEGDVDGALPLGFAAMLIGFLAFAYAYAKGYEGGNGAMEGLRFGLLIGVMLVGFSIVWNYILVPISGSFAIASAVDYLGEYAIYGAIVGAIYKPRAAA